MTKIPHTCAKIAANHFPLKQVVLSLMMAWSLSIHAQGDNSINLQPTSQTDNDWALLTLSNDYTFTSPSGHSEYIYGAKAFTYVEHSYVLRLEPTNASMTITGLPVRFVHIWNPDIRPGSGEDNHPSYILRVLPNSNNVDTVITWKPELNIEWDTDKFSYESNYDLAPRVLSLDNRHGQTLASSAMKVVFEKDVTINEAKRPARLTEQVALYMFNSTAQFDQNFTAHLHNIGPELGRGNTTGISLENSSLHLGGNVDLDLTGQSIFQSSGIYVASNSHLTSSETSQIQINLTNEEETYAGLFLDGVAVENSTVNLRGDTHITVKQENIQNELQNFMYVTYGLKAFSRNAPFTVQINRLNADVSSPRATKLAGVYIGGLGTVREARNDQ